MNKPGPPLRTDHQPTPIARRGWGAIASLVVTAAIGLFATKASGQAFERSVALAAPEIERLDPAAATHLENANRFLAEKQWDEAVEAIRRVMEGDPGQFVPVEQRAGYTRWIPVREYCQQRLAGLAFEAPEALKQYRLLVDPLAEQWYRQGVSEHREDLLRRIIEQSFASRWGDDALLLAGEHRLAVGDFAQARSDWQRISPLLTVTPKLAELLKAPIGSPLWLAVRGIDWDRQGGAIVEALSTPTSELNGCFPDTDLNLANLRARLALVSILEGSPERAKVEIELLGRMHPDAEGQIAGRQGKYVDVLNELAGQARAWPRSSNTGDWPTFGGNLARNGRTASDIDIAGRPTWTFDLPRLTAEREQVGASRLRVADDDKGLLSYFPIVVDGTVLLRSEVGQESLITALDLKTGHPKWEVDYPRRLWTLAAPAETSEVAASDAHHGLNRHAGVARFTLSAVDDKVFARMGSPVTGPASHGIDRLLAKDQGWVLGLDLTSEGKPLEGFPIRPESTSWAFEGTPVYAGGRMYVAMRRVDGPRAQLHVACFDLPTAPVAIDDSEDNSRPTGRMRWRTKIVAASGVGGGDVDELSHVLLTLAHGKLYCNTNLGAVARVSAETGRIDWITTYPRAAGSVAGADRNENHFFRDLTPCLLAGELAVVAPSDGVSVFAVEQGTGRLVWQLPPEQGSDIVHLLGSDGSVLNASGDYLYWIDLQNGRVLTQFPQGPPRKAGQAAPSPRGSGRGLVAGGHVWFPTRENIYVFDQRPAKGEQGWHPRGVRDIALASRGATGGNLVMADGVLLIASGDRLYAFDEEGPASAEPATTAEVR